MGCAGSPPRRLCNGSVTCRGFRHPDLTLAALLGCAQIWILVWNPMAPLHDPDSVPDLEPDPYPNQEPEVAPISLQTRALIWIQIRRQHCAQISPTTGCARAATSRHPGASAIPASPHVPGRIRTLTWNSTEPSCGPWTPYQIRNQKMPRSRAQPDTPTEHKPGCNTASLSAQTSVRKCHGFVSFRHTAAYPNSDPNSRCGPRSPGCLLDHSHRNVLKEDTRPLILCLYMQYD